jgi:hypothetical protein
MILVNLTPVTVSTTPIIVAAANANRRRIWITNVSPNPIRVGGPVAGNGQVISASNGYRLAQYEKLMIGSDGAPCYTGDIWAIREGASDGTANVIEERLA